MEKKTLRSWHYQHFHGHKEEIIQHLFDRIENLEKECKKRKQKPKEREDGSDK